MHTQITLYCNNDRDQHTVLENREPETAYWAILETLRNGLADFRAMARKVAAVKSISKSEKTRHEMIVKEMEHFVMEMETAGDPTEYTVRMCALVLVRMAEVALATVESFEMVKGTSKGRIKLAKQMADELVQKCRDWNVQPYETTHFASRVAARLNGQEG